MTSNREIWIAVIGLMKQNKEEKQMNRESAQLSPASTRRGKNESLPIDFVLREGASLSLPSPSTQQKNA